MARQLENQFFLYENYTKPEYMLQDMEAHKRMWKKMYGKRCSFKQLRNKNGVRIIVEERQAEKEGEER